MLKILKKILFLLFCLLIVVTLLFFSLGNTIIDYFIQENLRSVNTDDIHIEVNNPSIEFFKFSIENLTINKKIKFLNVPIKFDKLDFEPNLFTLFSNDKKFKAYSDFYSGQLKVDGSYLMDAAKLSSNINLKGALLEAHKLFKQFGIKGGSLSSECKEFEVVDNQISSAKCEVTLVNLNQPNDLSIPSSISGLPLKLNIPAVKIKEVKFNVDLNSKKIALNNFILVSDLANLAGNFELKKGSLDLNLDLLGRGATEFGALLRALSNSSQNVNKFKIRATKHFRDLKISARM